MEILDVELNKKKRKKYIKYKKIKINIKCQL